MYVAVYEYRMRPDKSIEYIKLEKQAIEIYLEHGCLGVEIYRDAGDPYRWMEINRYRDRGHYEEVAAAVEGDQRIRPLYEAFIGIFDAESQPTKSNYLRML
ncbi:MAG TPA: antibiotic biosynthesis monooxygenase [Patescibacteria group bacterium]|nr:antibiotic biosynthesis monooxygenase [Patescibacteria group bacterium]